MAEFIGGWTEDHLERALNKIASFCPTCQGKCTYICIQQCCIGADLICIDCDREHWLHRKNEFKVLFLDKKSVKNRSCRLRENLTELNQFLTSEKQLNERVIEFYQRLQDLYISAIYQVDETKNRFAKDEIYSDQIYEIMGKVLHSRKVQPEWRQQFQQYVNSLNLYDQPFTKIDSVTKLSVTLDRQRGSSDINTKKIEKILAKISEISWKCRSNLENFVLNTNIEQYIPVPNPALHNYNFNTIERSIEMLNDQKSMLTLKTSRAIIIKNNNNLPFSVPIQCHISELHTDSQLDSIPSELKSLSYLNSFYPTANPSKNLSMKIFPESLYTLRFAMNPQLKNRFPYQLDHLTNLKSLYIVDGGMNAQQLKYIKNFSIRQNLRMLCIMGTNLRQNCRNVKSYWCKIETCYSHRFDKLKRHYLISKRKMLQTALIQRRLALRDSSRCVENILQSCCSSLEVEIEHNIVLESLSAPRE